MSAAAREAAPGPVPDLPGWYGDLLGALPRLRDSLLGRMVPPPDARPRRSAVLVLFGEGPHGPDVLLTQRSAGMRSHAGQVAFPGGRIDPGDTGPAGAAVREAVEETGLDPAGVEVGGLAPTLWVPVTNYLVTPVLAWWRSPSPVAAVSPAEVVAVERVPLAELCDPANRFTVGHPSGYDSPGFEARGLFVWGFTAGVLTGLLALSGWERPWDAARVVPLPEQPRPQDVVADQAVADPPDETDLRSGS